MKFKYPLLQSQCKRGVWGEFVIAMLHPSLALGKEKRVKDLIFRALADDWPASAKRLFMLVHKAGADVSYQAVYKALQELAEERVVERAGRQYQLSKQWIHAMKTEYEKLEALHGKSPPSSKLCDLLAVAQIGDQLRIHSIPSVFMSVSAVKDFLCAIPAPRVSLLAKQIAEKNFTYVKSCLNGHSSVEHCLQKLKELVNLSYWGDIEYTFEDNLLKFQLHSDCYNFEQGRRFYEAMHEHFLALLGFRKVRSDPLSNTSFFEQEQQ